MVLHGYGLLAGPADQGGPTAADRAGQQPGQGEVIDHVSYSLGHVAGVVHGYRPSRAVTPS